MFTQIFLSEIISIAENGGQGTHFLISQILKGNNALCNGLKQREIELEEGSARVSWYETQLLIGQSNGGSPKFQGVSPKNI